LDQLEAYLPDEEEAGSSPSPFIDLLQTMKERWGDQTSTALTPTVEKVTTRERFSTSHIARNLRKLPEIELDDES